MSTFQAYAGFTLIGLATIAHFCLFQLLWGIDAHAQDTKQVQITMIWKRATDAKGQTLQGESYRFYHCPSPMVMPIDMARGEPTCEGGSAPIIFNTSAEVSSTTHVVSVPLATTDFYTTVRAFIATQTGNLHEPVSINLDAWKQPTITMYQVIVLPTPGGQAN